MHIEKVDCFRGWLIQAVNPICDANPQHLARYIIALVKKDKPSNELMRSCNDNLEVFLQGKTSAFVSKMFEAIASKVYESCPPVEDKELEEKCKGGDAARPAADSRGSQGENKPSALPSVGSKVTSDVRERRKSVQGESKHCTRVADSPPKSQTRRDELNGALSRKPESNLQGRSNDSDKSQSDDRLRSQIEREDVHERLGKGSWKRPPSPQGRVAGVSRRRSQEEEQKSQRLLEKGSVGVSNQAAAKRMSPGPLRSPEPERNVGSHQASNRGRQLNEHPHENSRISRANRPTRSPVTRRMPQTKERVGSHATSLDRTSHIRKRSRSAARSNSRSPSARSDSSRSSLESFSSKCSASKRVHVEKEPVVNSRSSTPLEEENEDRSVDMYHAVPRDGNRSAVSHPRCQDYDEKGFCVRGDRCPFDHGSDPYIVDESQFSTVLPFQGGVSVGLENGRLIQGQMRRPPIPSHPDAPVLPNVSRPPPPFLLRPMHPPPPPHYITSHGMPPPGYYQPSLSVQGGRPDVYIPPPADAYLPEPYKPKTVRGYRTAVMKPGTAAGLENSPDVWHATPDTQSSYQQQQQRFISSQVPVGRHTNLVRVPTQEDEGATEKTQVNAVTSVHAGLKRKASELDHESQPAYPATETETITPPPVKKTALDHPGVRQNSSHANKTLEIRKIPRDQNTISNINNHFSKFGTIINLQVGWEGDPQAALVSFASSAQASAAYRSQEPFLNNRFIKIFWHNSEKQQQPAVEQQQTNVASQPTIELQQQRPKRHVFPERHQLQLNNRLTKTRQQLPNLNVAAVQALSSEESKPPSKAASDATATDLRPTHDVSLTKIQRRPSKDFTAKAALTKKIEEVTQQSQLLLTKYVNEQKALFEKLEKDKATMGAEDRASIIQTIKKLAAKIEDVKSTVSAVLKPAPVEPRPKVVHPTVPRGSLRKVNVRRFSGSGKSSPGVSASSSQLSLAQGSLFQDKQHAQKAILDTELELMTCQKEGHDADDLRKRVMALKEEATSLGIFNNSSGQGRGFIRGRGRGGHAVGRRWAVPRYRANPLTVDRRPKQLLVTGFQPEEKDELLAHITSFGALDSNSFDMTVPSLLVSFKSRIVAEKVAAEGCTFKGKNLTMVWQKSVLSELNRGTERENTGVAVKPLVHTDLKINATGENMPNKNKPGHVIIPELEEDRESEETNPKFLCSVDLQNQDTAVTAEDDNSELLGLDEEDDDDDEEERSWRR